MIMGVNTDIASVTGVVTGIIDIDIVIASLTNGINMCTSGTSATIIRMIALASASRGRCFRRVCKTHPFTKGCLFVFVRGRADRR